MATHTSGSIEVEHREGAKSAVIYAHGGWAAGGFIAKGSGMTIVPPWTTVVFLAADGEPALAPSPQRLVSGAIGEQIIGGIKMHEEIMFSSIAQNGSTVKNYEISRHQQSDSVGNRLNINRPQGKVWSLIMPIEGKSPKLSDVFAELSRLKLEYETLFYAACRVNL